MPAQQNTNTWASNDVTSLAGGIIEAESIDFFSKARFIHCTLTRPAYPSCRAVEKPAGKSFSNLGHVQALSLTDRISLVQDKI